MATSVDSLIANARSYADSAVGAALARIEALAQIEDLVASLTFVDNTPTWSYTDIGDWARTLYNEVRGVNPANTKDPRLGNFTNIQDVTYTPEDFKELVGMIKEIMEEIADLPNRFVEAALLFDLVGANITEGLNGSLGITEAEETALWGRGFAREREIQTYLLDDVIDKYASLGHPIPPGATLKAMQEAGRVHAYNAGQYNREITIKRAELYRETRAFYVDAAIRAASAQIGINNEKFQTLAAAANSLVGIAQAEAAQKGLEFQTYELKYKKEASFQNVLVDIYKSDIQGWGAQFDTLARCYAVLQQANADQLSADRVVASESIERAKAQIMTFQTQTNVSVQAIVNIAQVLSQKVAGALSSLNTLVGQITELTEE